MVDFKDDDDGHRYGDWQHKGLRKDVNDVDFGGSQEVWYKQTFWIIVLLLVFWPLGLFLALKSNWPVFGKFLAVAFVAFCVIGMLWIFNQNITSAAFG